MAGSDKKEQRLAAGEATSGGAAPLAVDPPDVSHLVIDASGLMLRKTLDSDLKTTITTWSGNLPSNPGDNEIFKLQYARAGSNEWTTLDQKIYSGGSGAWVPMDFTLSSEEFLLKPENEGAFDLRYHHTNFQGTEDESQRARIFIDKIPPNGGRTPDKMMFTITPPITEDSFGGKEFLEAEIPDWAGDQSDIRVAYGWIKGELPEDPDSIELIGPIPVTPNMKVEIPKNSFIKAGDGMCCGGYVLIDKAGNVSPLSRYELMSVALGPLPLLPLKEPSVEDDTGGDLLREDIIDGGVKVHVDRVNNGKEKDSIVVRWGSKELSTGTPVGSNPSAGFDIFVPWETIWQEYGNAQGAVATAVSYTVYRGVEPFASDVATIKCNLSIAGPVNPEPEPGNPILKAVTIVGQSADDNKLIDTDENKEVLAKIELVAPLTDGDKYQVMWNGTPNGAPYEIDVTIDNVGDTIAIPLQWDVIRDEGPSTAMPVWYELTNPLHVNPQEPEPRTEVEITFLVHTLPTAVPLNTNVNGDLNCTSLRWNADKTQYGFEYRIPASPRLKENDIVTVTWNGYKDFDAPGAPIVTKTEPLPPVTREQEMNGIVWLVQPYDDYLLPMYETGVAWAKGDVTYTIAGKPAAALPSETKVGLNQGSTSCNIPPKP